MNSKIFMNSKSIEHRICEQDVLITVPRSTCIHRQEPLNYTLHTITRQQQWRERTVEGSDRLF